jgi:D-alanine-D-alanine ligase
MTRIGLLFGGESPEFEVSLVSARNVAALLKEAGFEVFPIGVAPNGKICSGSEAFHQVDVIDRLFRPSRLHWSRRLELEQWPIDVLFPMIHGMTGEDGGIQGLCEFIGLPYIGGDVLNQALCMDKLATRGILKANGLPQPRWVGAYRIRGEEDLNAYAVEIVDTLNFPIFVKPSRTGSSIGISRVADPKDLLFALKEAFAYDYRLIAEEAVPKAQEIECAALGDQQPLISPFGRIVPQRAFYDFEEKYLGGATQFELPAHLNPSLEAQARDFALRAWDLLGCFGMARIDFLCTDTTAYLNEINTIPGFTSISMYPKLLELAGVAQVDIVKTLVQLAMSRKQTDQRKTQFQSKSDWYKSP